MSVTLQPVAVFGATGVQGGAVARFFAAAGVPVIAITRSIESISAKKLPAGVEIRYGDFNAPESLSTALAGASAAFLVTDFWGALASGATGGDWDRAADMEYSQGAAAVAACKLAGIKHIVFSGLESPSALTGGVLNVPMFEGKARVEQAIRASGIPFTFLHLSSYCENFEQFVARDGRELDLNLPCPRTDAAGDLVVKLPLEDAVMDMVCVADLGQAVFSVLCDPAKHAGATYGLVSDSLTGDEIAAVLQRVMGVKVSYEPVTTAEFMSWGFPGAREIGAMFEFTNRHRAGLRSPEDTKMLIPKPTTFEEWAASTVARFPPA